MLFSQFPIKSLLTENNFAVGTSAVQISGQIGGAQGVLSGVSGTFVPSYRRSGLLLTNCGATTLYISFTLSASSTRMTFPLLPNSSPLYLAANGSVSLWAISSAANGTLEMIEVQ